MAFKMECPHCKRALNVTEKAFGKTVPCPSCQHAITVPSSPPRTVVKAAQTVPPRAPPQALGTPPLPAGMPSAPPLAPTAARPTTVASAPAGGSSMDYIDNLGAHGATAGASAHWVCTTGAATPLKDSGTVTVLSVIGLVFGLIGMLASFVPCLGALAFLVGMPAALASGIGLAVAYSQHAKRTFAIVALTISLIGVVISGAQYMTIVSAGKAAHDELQRMNNDFQKANHRVQPPRRQRDPAGE